MYTLLLSGAALLAASFAQPAVPPVDRQPLIQLVDQSGAGPSTGAIIIDEVARRILYGYYQQHLQVYEADQASKGNGHKNKDKGLPPGLAKKGKLPPGIEKQLVRNGRLPPGLQYRDLPPDLLVQLPAVAPGYRYLILDDRVMLIRAATDIIMDILQVPAAR
jgi:hypothetical protein